MTAPVLDQRHEPNSMPAAQADGLLTADDFRSMLNASPVRRPDSADKSAQFSDTQPIPDIQRTDTALAGPREQPGAGPAANGAHEGSAAGGTPAASAPKREGGDGGVPMELDNLLPGIPVIADTCPESSMTAALGAAEDAPIKTPGSVGCDIDMQVDAPSSDAAGELTRSEGAEPSNLSNSDAAGASAGSQAAATSSDARDAGQLAAGVSDRTPFDPDTCKDPLVGRLGKCLTSGTDVSCSRVDAVPELLAIIRDCKNEGQRRVVSMMLAATVEKKRADVVAALLDGNMLGALKGWLLPETGAAGPHPSPEFVVSLLQLLSKLPITDGHLRESGMGKVVNQLHKKSAVPQVVAAAKATLDPWKAAFGSRGPGAAASSAPAASAAAKGASARPAGDAAKQAPVQRAVKPTSVNPLGALVDASSALRTNPLARLATNPLAAKTGGIKRLASLSGPKNLGQLGGQAMTPSDTSPADLGSAAARAAAASARHEEEWKDFQPPAKKARSGKRVTWARGAKLGDVRVEIRHYRNEIRNKVSQDIIQDAEWGFVEVDEDSAAPVGALRSADENVALDQHAEQFRKAVQQEHANEREKHHALLQKALAVPALADPSVDAALWHNCKPTCSWDADWFPPEMERPAIGQGEDSLEAQEQEARERRNNATPPNPRSAPAEPFPADRGATAWAPVNIPPESAVANAAAAAPAAAALPASAGVDAAAGATAVAAAAATAPPLSLPLVLPAAAAGGAPQPIILQHGQTIMPAALSGGVPGQPSFIILTQDGRLQLGASSALQLPAHLQPAMGAHGQMILQMPQAQFQEPQPAGPAAHDRGAPPFGDGPRHELHGRDRDWDRPGGGGGLPYSARERERKEFFDGNGDGDFARRGGDHGDDRDHDGGWNDADDHGYGGRHGGRGDRGRGGGRGRGRLCAYFNTPKGCRKGEDCPFAHVRGGDGGGRGRGERGRGRGPSWGGRGRE